ncbi:hypothetical protein BCV70DRAFT_15389 [Testicularia cyperi]|uniref:Nudix hydrolase domain-containing protein n=1 Tax=Testicularia cyperi TaxID=1882483 RepID=A0A317XYG2_9BASI|nr:hypothetical protein BCV70DRAFT_15389 [Testicularia cyperi]
MTVKETIYNILFGPDRSPAPSTSTSKLPIPPSALAPLTTRSLKALEILCAYTPPPGSEPCPEAVPAYRRAAVLLGLFAGRNGELYVVLSKRSSRLRSHGGDTAIPGGRFEPTDPNLEYTARREAYEETGLPIDPTKTIKLCELPPFLSANELVVTPFVMLLTDHTVQPHLNPREVDSLFSLPLVSFLYHHPPTWLRPSLRLPPTPDPQALKYMPKNEVLGASDWHTCRDIIWLGGNRIRRHAFWDERNPIRGLTADILIHAASIAYAQPPDFSLDYPGEPTRADLIKLAFSSPLALKRYRVKPRVQFLRPQDALFGNKRAEDLVGEELKQPQDDKSDFPVVSRSDDKAKAKL